MYSRPSDIHSSLIQGSPMIPNNIDRTLGFSNTKALSMLPHVGAIDLNKRRVTPDHKDKIVNAFGILIVINTVI